MTRHKTRSFKKLKTGFLNHARRKQLQRTQMKNLKLKPLKDATLLQNDVQQQSAAKQATKT
jgi:hypothetical protein